MLSPLQSVTPLSFSLAPSLSHSPLLVLSHAAYLSGLLHV